MNNQINKAIEYVRPKIHKAKPGTICKCGVCIHQMKIASIQFNVSEVELKNKLGVAKEILPVKVVKRKVLNGSVGANAIITVNGKHCEAAEGMLALIKKIN